MRQCHIGFSGCVDRPLEIANDNGIQPFVMRLDPGNGLSNQFDRRDFFDRNALATSVAFAKSIASPIALSLEVTVWGMTCFVAALRAKVWRGEDTLLAKAASDAFAA